MAILSRTSPILQDRKRLLAIMKDGIFHKAPEAPAPRASASETKPDPAVVHGAALPPAGARPPHREVQGHLQGGIRGKAGYEAIRNERFKRMQAAGLIPANMTPSEPPALWPKWEQLFQQQKDVEARRMAVYAAMVDSLDQNIGRLVSYLKKIGESRRNEARPLFRPGLAARDQSAL
ncbi:hypothetical protein [Azospirillum himalayense]|uniref:LTXXQ motif family protein n=1 Tax=Azospirillum himalayense TaxID=654847 RepID=A0ABW0GEQ7_9PROT